MNIEDALNDPGLKSARRQENAVILPVAHPACWHNRLRDRSLGNVESDGDINLPPTTMIGTRPTVTLTFSPRKRARQEAEYVAGLSFLGKLHHRFFGFLRKQSD